MITINANYRGANIHVDTTPGQVAAELAAAVQAVRCHLPIEDQGCTEPCGENDPEELDVPEETAAWMDEAPTMPVYQSHKQVKGAPIVGFEVLDNGRACLLLDVGHGGAVTTVTREGWTSQFRGSDSDMGYYVEYADGYTSWSPTNAFRDGYTRIA